MILLKDLNKPGCIRTYSGIYLDVFNLRPDQIVIEDIAHALSNECRWGSHSPFFYSVAQHSWLGSHNKNLSALEKMMFLLHDASEAYLRDMATPIKCRLPEYVELEEKVMRVIFTRFGLPFPMPEIIHTVDRDMLNLEWKYVIHAEEFPEMDSPFKEVTHSFGKQQFLDRYNEINQELLIAS